MKRKIGQLYNVRNRYDNEVNLSLLAQVSYSTVGLIDIKTGNRWREPVEVEDVENISADEWKEIKGTGIKSAKLAKHD